MAQRSTYIDGGIRGLRQEPKSRSDPFAVGDDLPAALPVTVAELEAVERFVPELGAFLDTPAASSRVALPDTNPSAACSSLSQETADQS